MSERVKLIFLYVLWLLALAIVALSAANALQTVKDFQQENTATKAGDVNTIRPWMTIHVISHVYHVPEDYLNNSLHIVMQSSDRAHGATLYQLASRQHMSLDRFVETVKQVIRAYRKEHISSSLSSPPPLFAVLLSGETKE
ncbi:MAG TPA: hypothetical protein VGD98_16945 [Ktedonobacteraceae bacterium]